MNNSILIIMAGGKSSRMKRDKALLPFRGYNSLAEYQYRRFKSLFHRVYISAKSDKFDFPVDIIEDSYEESSPLIAIISIFERLKDINEVAILSVDSPYIQKEQFQTLLKNRKKEIDIIVANSKNGIEPLCGIYRRTIIPIAKEMLSNNRHSLKTLLERCNSKNIYFENSNLFTNLNYPEDYKLAKTISYP